MTNDRPVYILPLVNCNVYWPIIGHLFCMTSFFIGHYTLFQFSVLRSVGNVLAQKHFSDLEEHWERYNGSKTFLDISC